MIKYKFKRYGKYYNGELSIEEIKEYLEKKEMTQVKIINT